MSLPRLVALGLLVVAAGCAGLGGSADSPTTGVPAESVTDDTTTQATASTTDPHTAVGTSHISEHLTVRASYGVENVTVILEPDADSATYAVPEGEEIELTREIHDRGHDVRVAVERDGDVVFEKTIYGYEHHEVRVLENSTTVSTAVV